MALRRALTTLLLAAPALCWNGGHRDIHSLRARNIIYNGQIADTYDFIIAGGGTAGLVLAARLSEDANTTVLVLEAGDTGDAVMSSIAIPGNAYYSSLLGTSYDWQYKTVPQVNAGSRSLGWARGKVLGGSSAVNGMYMVRPSELEFDAWSNMQGGAEGYGAWNWDNMFAAMKKSETFHPPSADVQAEADIQYNPASHGLSGPVQVSYPGYVLPVVGNWTSTLDWIGILHNEDANGGDSWGGYVATSSINPSNWTRSYARSAYIDALPPRSNLAVLANATVTQIQFAANSSAGNLTATGVQYTNVRGGALKTVSARKEVIVAGGAIGSPQILMLSGVGPRDVLEALNINVNVELPGVGQHLQDHISTEVVWKTSDETAASIHASNSTNLNGTSSPFLSFINSATAYPNITDLFGTDWAPTFQQEVTANFTAAAASLVPSQYSQVVEGYKAIYNVTLNTLLTPVGQVELLLSLTGTAVGGDQSIAIQAALQHPFSQGRLYINSSDPFDAPVIDPQYLSHPADGLMLREGLKLARKLGQTAPLSAAMTTELSPGPAVSTDADWDAYLAGAIGTEYHPSCSCAMLPQAQGGVVDPQLRVYGTANVRVVDASVFPIEFAAHLQAPVYGLAEQAASIIRAHYNGVAPPDAVTSTSTSSSAASSSTGGSGSGSGKKSAARPTFGAQLALVGLGAVGAVCMLGL